MINIAQFRELIVKPVLEDLVLDSLAAEELLIFTCANESLGGTYLHQVNGPALGIYQMEPETYTDIWNNYINKNGRISLIMTSQFQCSRIPQVDRLIWDIRFATVMTRLFYARIEESLPDPTNIDAMWNYYKTYYNTSKGSAMKFNAVANYRKFLNGC